MSLFVIDLAKHAVGIIRNDPPTESISLTSYFNEKLNEVVKLVGTDFELWLIVLNIVQGWLISDPERFGDCHRFFMEGDGAVEHELPACIDPNFWRLLVYRHLHGGRRDLGVM